MECLVDENSIFCYGKTFELIDLFFGENIIFKDVFKDV